MKKLSIKGVEVKYDSSLVYLTVDVSDRDVDVYPINPANLADDDPLFRMSFDEIDRELGYIQESFRVGYLMSSDYGDHGMTEEQRKELQNTARLFDNILEAAEFQRKKSKKL